MYGNNDEREHEKNRKNLINSIRKLIRNSIARLQR